MAELSIPELALVVLIGSTGSGKSTFAHKHFRSTAIVSSDVCRGIVSDDENDQAATPEAFALLHHIAGTRLRLGLRTVVDATNVQPTARRELIELARAHDVLPVAIVLDVPDRVCLERNALRPDRAELGSHVVVRQQRELRRGLRQLEREGFRKVHVLRGVEEIDAATIVNERLWNDKRELTGPFDVIGDVHGCRSELETLLGQLGYELLRDELGRAVDARHPDGRTAVFVGDLVDRGPDTPGVLRLVMGMVASANALCVTGNHEFKLVRALDGRKVKIAHGLAESLEQLEAEDPVFRKTALEWCRSLVSHYVLDGGNLVVAHAGLKEEFHGRASGRVRSFAMYGETTGETDEYGFPVRYPWATDYRGRATVLYGHTPVTHLQWVNNTLCLDTGVVFGGRLSALRYPEKETVSVAAEQVWFEPTRPLEAPDIVGADGAVHRDPGVLDLDDVIGRRVVETRHLGRVGVQEDAAAAALEVMSRFAIDPRWLVYLPPTMSPCATSTLDGYLEHPAQAFEYYRSEGVRTVVCEEKHMGSRAVVVVARTVEAARDRFGIEDGSTGAVYTRTGRPFFDDAAQTETLVARVRVAAEKAGLFEELGTDWLLLDAELLPWSAKAMGLLRSQYAAVGAAARASLGAAEGVLAAATARGLEVGHLAERTTARRTDAEAFTTAYGRYCWPVDGLDGVRLAPFQILAASGVNYAVREHNWHLARIDRLIAADPELFTPTRRMIVDLTDATGASATNGVNPATDENAAIDSATASDSADAAAIAATATSGAVSTTGDGLASEAAATAWWTELTSVGGEGMVVKPLDSFTLGTGTRSERPVQPGVKCRGPEYLRIIYGPEYLRPENLQRLRQRGLGRKRSLALREYALGLESLYRFVAEEPLWRVHEAVFAVLALETEPVDPRL
ncbi:polynucleotide kinase-phosphatase [Nocardia uniformis]|uniref:Polynucleotide kinase-phosphatase n=1 Tax=Nocardia uniformis TaxID=53432 RepID=A0A849CJ96_9NOCA|nr:polynucleotide kinase-phosphatase [Nocardia uniformis]NNH74321.1 polynucleotide kinase-phosphatase [Nocardia uniformis]